MSRFEAPKQLLEYALNKYSEYIDNVDIDELISWLKSDKELKKTNDEFRVLHDIMQLLVDECGPDVVNEIELSEDNECQLYASVEFTKHVNITKDQISELEFNVAKFLDGVTVYSPVLPRYALSYSIVNGTVDLTRVEVLGDSNLLYPAESPCVVKLSTHLKKISPKALYHIHSTTVEYDGTVREFSKFILAHWKKWPQKLRAKFKESVENRKIHCSDGVWNYESWWMTFDWAS